MNFNEFLQSKNFKITLLIIIVVIIVLMIFRFGMTVGFYKARFSYQWGDNYHKNFIGPRDSFGNNFRDNEFINPHGIIGQIIQINDSSLIIKGRENLENIINILDNTIIMRFRDKIKLSNLKVDDLVVVLGDPNGRGQINARLIRVMPSPGPEILPFRPMPK